MSQELGRLRLRAALLLAAMFVVGGFAGAGLVRLVGPQPPGFGAHDPFRHLELTREQRQQARAIMEKHRPALDAIVAETRPRVQAIQDQIDQELGAILTPEQKKRLAERPRHLPPPPHGPPGFGPPPSPPNGPPPPGP